MKKHTKAFLTTFLIFICSICISFSASAADGSDIVVSLRIYDPVMVINGVEAEIDAGRGTEPMVIDGRTLVPIRAIIEAFGGIVGWDGDTQAVELTMGDDVITLVIDSKTAYLNNTPHMLDVAPAIINGRTMLPIRFIAEGFNLGVAWEGEARRVTLIRNSFDAQEYDYLMSVLPAYSGSPYAEINNGTPFFKEYEIIGGSFEYYSTLDELGRCDVCMASVGEDIMPTDDRGSISSVTPTGWINASYDTISGKYLYNRCHLIGYQLTGENANERNLITGTRYLNIEGMLPFENLIDDYIENTGNNVMYRVTPVFKGNNLVADGVLLEAGSVEDGGQGISFCVYCYNVQPDIIIDYATGASRMAEDEPEAETIPPIEPDESISQGIYRTPSGKRYHIDAECGGKNSYPVSMEEALGAGLTPCSKCAK